MRTERLAAIRQLKRTSATQVHDTPLTERTVQVACGIVLGLGNKDIGKALGISQHNVRDRLTLLMHRFLTNTRTGVAGCLATRYCKHCPVIEAPDRPHELGAPADGDCALRAALGTQASCGRHAPPPQSPTPAPPTNVDPLQM